MSACVPPLSTPRGVKAFKKWLTAAGAKVLPTKGEYEVIRFRGEGPGLSLVHCNKRGRASFQGEAAHLWAKYEAGNSYQIKRPVELDPIVTHIGPDSGRIVLDMAAEAPITIADVMARLRVTMRAASQFLSSKATDGCLTRSGGGSGAAFRWEAPAHPQPHHLALGWGERAPSSTGGVK